MSYILEAIRKSEWERRRGSVPRLLDQHAAAPLRLPAGPLRRPWTAYALGLGVTLLIVSTVTTAAAFWVMRGIPGFHERPVAEGIDTTIASRLPQGDKPPLPAAGGSSSPPTAAAAPAGAAPPMVVVPPGTGWALLPMVAAGSGPVVATPWGGSPAADPDEQMFPDRDLSDTELAALLDSHGGPRSAKTVAPKSAAAAPMRPDDGPGRGAGPAPRGEEPGWYATARAELAAMAAMERTGRAGSRSTAAAVAPTLPEASVSRSPLPGAGVVSAASIDDLPAAVREALPAISLSVHLYADDPTLRRVRVNNLLLHEGESVGNGLEVAAITRDGVIFRFRGAEFFLPANENWQPQGTAAR